MQKTATTGEKVDGIMFSYKIDKFVKISNIGIDTITLRYCFLKIQIKNSIY